AASIAVSLLLGFVLYLLSSKLKKIDEFGSLWASGASIFAVVLVTTFIIWMIRNGSEIKSQVEQKTAYSLSAFGIFILSFMLIAREGVEIVVFSFAGEYQTLSILAGLAAALLLSLFIYFALFNISIPLIFKVTLIYLVIQAGYLFGYGIHELLGSLKSLGVLESGHPLLIKVFDLSAGILNHKSGSAGVPLNVLAGWYSRPEWPQFTAQYAYTFGLFALWITGSKKRKSVPAK
ncbi:MAG: hydrogenase, partial [Spirochaetales bacterium]